MEDKSKEETMQDRIAKVSSTEYQKILQQRIKDAITMYRFSQNTYLDEIEKICQDRNLHADIGKDLATMTKEVVELETKIRELTQMNRTIWNVNTP